MGLDGRTPGELGADARGSAADPDRRQGHRRASPSWPKRCQSERRCRRRPRVPCGTERRKRRRRDAAPDARRRPATSTAGDDRRSTAVDRGRPRGGREGDRRTGCRHAHHRPAGALGPVRRPSHRRRHRDRLRSRRARRWWRPDPSTSTAPCAAGRSPALPATAPHASSRPSSMPSWSRSTVSTKPRTIWTRKCVGRAVQAWLDGDALKMAAF